MSLEDNTASTRKMETPLAMHAKCEILKLVRKEENRWRKSQDAVDDLERRLKLLEDHKVRLEEVLEVKTGSESVIVAGLENSLLEDAFLKSYSTVYVSPIFEEKNRLGTQRSNGFVEASLEEEANIERMKDKRDLIIQKLKAELMRLRARESGYLKAKQREMQVDKMNSCRTQSSSDSHPKEMHTLIVKEQKDSINVVASDTAARNDSEGEKWDLENAQSRFHVNNFAPNGFMKVVKKKLKDGKRETKELSSSVTQDMRNASSQRLVQILNTTEETDKIPRASTAIMQNRPEESCTPPNNDYKDSATSIEKKQIFSSELQALQDAICNVLFNCQEEVSKFSSEMDTVSHIEGKQAVYKHLYRNLLCELVNKLKHLDEEVPSSFFVGESGGMGGMCIMRPLGSVDDSERLKVTMENTKEQFKEDYVQNNSAIEKQGKHANKLHKDAIDLEMKEKQLIYEQSNIQLTYDTTTMHSHSYYKQLVASLENQLKNTQVDLKRTQESVDSLTQQLKTTEAESMTLQRLLEEKDRKMEEFKKRMMAIQNETDSTVIEKFELVNKLQQLYQEAEKRKQIIKELTSQKEELTGSIQAKEDQLASVHEQATRLQKMTREKSQENVKLTQDLTNTRKELKDLREGDAALKRRYSFVKSKLADAEYELSQREEALERMTKHLAAILEGNEFVLEVKDDYLKESGSTKEEHLTDQLKQSRMIIDELEEKLGAMEQEILKARTEMRMMKPAGPQAG